MDKKNRKIKEAVAIKYSPYKDSAPKIIASGKGIVADNIIQKADQSNVPIHHDSSLAHALTELQIGQDIPPEVYEVVAQILLFVAHIDEKLGMNDEKYK